MHLMAEASLKLLLEEKPGQLCLRSKARKLHHRLRRHQHGRNAQLAHQQRTEVSEDDMHAPEIKFF
jgi:hypothetical protein